MLQLSGGGPSEASLGQVDVCVQSVEPPPPHCGAIATREAEPTKKKNIRVLRMGFT
jgi:hypothetical protein